VVLFQRSEVIGAEAAGTPEGAGVVGYWGTWTLTLIVLALIGIAVGDELAIAHPDDDATLGFTILTFGGPALFLLAQVIFRRGAVGDVPRSRLLGLAALAILAVATAPLTLIVGIAASSAVLVAVAIADTMGDGGRPRGASAQSDRWPPARRSRADPGIKPGVSRARPAAGRWICEPARHIEYIAGDPERHGRRGQRPSRRIS
jgi:hypothetical protein